MKNTAVQKDGFPELVQHKSCAAKIYRVRHRAKWRYEVRHHNSDGLPQRSTFDEYALAKDHADEIVREMAKGGLDLIALRGKERYVYELAMGRIRPLGVGLDEAAAQYAEVMKMLDGKASLRDAVGFYITHRPTNLPQITVQAVLDEFLEHKIKDVEVSKVYLRDLKNRLGNFAKAFQCPISIVTKEDITRYLRSLGVGKRSRTNHRRNIGTLFNYAKDHGYLPKDHDAIPKESTCRSDRRVTVQVFTPPEMTTLLEGAGPDLVVPLAITAFSGVRAEELKRLDWRHVRLEEGFIEIPDEIAKTGVRRLVPVSENLAAWLLPHRHAQGGVVVYKNLANQYGKLAARLSFKWKRNALRHSFVSYRVADIKNVPQTALEAGNSVQMVQRHYLRVVTEKAAKDWFGIMPTTLAALPAREAQPTSVPVPRPEPLAAA